jgi:hypothetical protein
MKLQEQINKMKTMMGLNEDMTPDEEKQMYLDIISMDPDNPKYQRYKDTLKQKFNVDFDTKYGDHDSRYVENIDINNIKSPNDFMSFNNWLIYAKKVSQTRGYLPHTIYNLHRNYDIPNIINQLAQDLQFTPIKRDYDSHNGNSAAVSGNYMYYTDVTANYDIFHELGHIFDHRFKPEGLANNPAYSPTPYGTNPGETIAENFAIYFINPTALNNWCPEVYKELDRIIPNNWKTIINNILNHIQ